MTPEQALTLVRDLEAKHGGPAVRWALAFLDAEGARDSNDRKDSANEYFYGIEPYKNLTTEEVAERIVDFDEGEKLDGEDGFIGITEANTGMKAEEEPVERRWVWIPHDGEGVLIYAQDEDDAYEQAIANRMENGQTREEAEGWFESEDSLTEITSELTKKGS